MGDDALPPFVPGLELSERFFRTAVEPLLARHFPRLRYAAGRLGRGSDVMGFDTTQSRDHHWGPKTTVFLADDATLARYEDAIVTMLANELPFTVDGYPTHFDQPSVDGGFLAYFGPLWLFNVVTTAWLSRGATLPIIADARQLLWAEVILRATYRGLRNSKDHRFDVTDKGAIRTRTVVHWKPLKWLILVGGLTVAGLCYRALELGGQSAGTYDVFAYFWSYYNLLCITTAAAVCVEPNGPLARIVACTRFEGIDTSVRVSRPRLRRKPVSVRSRRKPYSRSAVRTRPVPIPRTSRTNEPAIAAMN